MVAVIQLQGKQFSVQEGDSIYTDLILDQEVGKPFQIQDVILMHNTETKETFVGQPLVEGASVELEIAKEVKGQKIVVFKFRSNKNSKKKKGHRQRYHQVLVKKIQVQR